MLVSPRLTKASPTALAAPEVSAEVIEEVRQAICSVEDQYDVLACAVRKPDGLGIGTGAPHTFTVWFYSEDWRDGNKIESAARVFHGRHAHSEGWGVHVGPITLRDFEGWLDCFKGEPLKFPTRSGAEGSFLISPVVHGEELMTLLQSKAKEVFGEDILSRWVDATIRREVMLAVKDSRELKRRARKILTRRSLLNRIELREMRAFIARIIKAFEDQSCRFVVALDGSARPIGKALGWYWEEAPTILFLDPHPLKKLDFGIPSEVGEAKGVLEKEFPQLFEALSSDPSQVLFIDDQCGYGSTTRALTNLVEALSGSQQIRHMVMTPWTGDNTPSWLQKRDIQGLRLVEDRFTFQAEDAPTEKSKQFYRKLREYAEAWKRNGLNVPPQG